MLPYHHPPTQEIKTDWLSAAGVRLLVQREDLNHPSVSGNKWWKLRDNLAEAMRLGKPIITFGGAFSNHIYATAAAAAALQWPSVGIIRGERVEPLNHTLSFAEQHGVRLQFVSRSDYRRRDDPTWIQQWLNIYGDSYVIPEGGTNGLAVTACAAWARQLPLEGVDEVMLAVGTGGTTAGLITGLPAHMRLTGVPVLKPSEFLYDEIRNRLPTGQPLCTWRLLTQYHHGGYAKVNPTLLAFIRQMYTEHQLPLDPIYTGKLFWAIREEVLAGHIARGTTILAIHTGGLQGAQQWQSDIHPDV